MIPCPVPPLRRVLAPVLAVLALASAVVGPVLDATDSWRGPVAESAHDGTACAHGHDHSICTQVAANAGLAVAPTRHSLHDGSLGGSPPRANPELPGGLERCSSLGPRAPPLA